MASPAEKKWMCAQQIETKLNNFLKEKEGRPTFNDIDQQMHEFRIVCQETMFLDFDYAANVSVGNRLWACHILVNNRYRKLLDQYRKGDQKKLVVERRKLEKHYADYIKTSSHFYKGFIQRLASHFGGMHKLKRVANCMHLSLASVENPVIVSDYTADLLESCCHATLLRLGDLSRYRNMIKSKDRSWVYALSYYELANDLCPESGTAHNQMAVIALADQNHLDAVYHLYRATTAIEPHILARGNLEIEFKKIIGAWEKQRVKPKMDSLATLVWWFVLLHSKFYDGMAFSTHHELEKEVLSRLALLLQEQSIIDILPKLVLINVAAQSTSIARINEERPNIKDETLQSFYFCLEFNIRTMNVLLRAMLPELEDTASGEDIDGANNGSATQETAEKISPTVRRVLPALRQYSIWVASCLHLIASIPPSYRILQAHVTDMWKLYAAFLTSLTSYFPVLEFKTVPYLLEEDSSTVGFEPFRRAKLSDACNFYSDAERPLKPRFTDPGMQRQNLNLEMQSRVLDIVLSALSLVQAKEIPLTLKSGENGSVFSYLDIGNPLDLPPSANVEPTISSPSLVYGKGAKSNQLSSPRDYDCPTPPGYSLPKHPIHVSGTVDSPATLDSHQSMDTDMHRMVDDLIGYRSTSIDETSYGMHSATANEVFAPMMSDSFDNRLQSTPQMLPSIPGLYTSAFTPRANELQPSSPRRPSTARQLSPLSLSTNDDRLLPAGTFDNVAGFGGNSSSVRRSSRLVSNPISQSVAQTLQENLGMQFTSSSRFPESSNLSIDMTQQRLNRLGITNNMEYENNVRLQSSIWDGSQQAAWPEYSHTPPGGQGG